MGRSSLALGSRVRLPRSWAWRLLELRPGMSVLDLACGHGDLANRLAVRGCQVTGLDSSAVFLDRARAGAAAAGVSVDYVAGDMRQLPWTGRFDGVVNWSTAFGYFDDTTNRAVLAGIARVLEPGGRLAMDLDNLTSFLGSYCPSRVVAAKRQWRHARRPLPPGRADRPVRGGAHGYPQWPDPLGDLRRAAVRLPRAAGLATRRGVSPRWPATGRTGSR